MSDGSMMRIVLTGGPGAGKSAVSAALADAEPERFARVPEAATEVYRRLGTRWDLLDDAGRRRVQREIYELQVAQEQRIAQANPGRILLLDRGTVDGSAYWPDGPEAYWQDLGTTLAVQLSRYDAVIWMESTASIGLYDGSGSNPVRCESAEEAIGNGEKLRRLWSAHPRMLVVPATRRPGEKVQRVRELIEAMPAF